MACQPRCRGPAPRGGATQYARRRERAGTGCGPTGSIAPRTGRLSYSIRAEVHTEGPVVPERHYCIPPLERFDLAAVLERIADSRYSRAARAAADGKTSALLALRDLLNSGAEGDFRCVYVNVEAAQAMREDVGRAMRVILGELASRARSGGDEFLYAEWPDILAAFSEGALAEALTRWCEAASAPVVLLIDEIDSLIGDTLIAVLRQLRGRYDRRPASFPQSVVLCGVRDVRDYRIRSSSENAAIAGGSAFNVRADRCAWATSPRRKFARWWTSTRRRRASRSHRRRWTRSGGGRRASRGW